MVFQIQLDKRKSKVSLPLTYYSAILPKLFKVENIYTCQEEDLLYALMVYIDISILFC